MPEFDPKKWLEALEKLVGSFWLYVVLALGLLLLFVPIPNDALKLNTIRDGYGHWAGLAVAFSAIAIGLDLGRRAFKSFRSYRRELRLLDHAHKELSPQARFIIDQSPGSVIREVKSAPILELVEKGLLIELTNVEPRKSIDGMQFSFKYADPVWKAILKRRSGGK
jgi:hypothetical protein